MSLWEVMVMVWEGRCGLNEGSGTAEKRRGFLWGWMLGKRERKLMKHLWHPSMRVWQNDAVINEMENIRRGKHSGLKEETWMMYRELICIQFLLYSHMTGHKATKDSKLFGHTIFWRCFKTWVSMEPNPSLFAKFWGFPSCNILENCQNFDVRITHLS